MPQPTVSLPPEAFAASCDKRLYWLGNAGFLINSHSTTGNWNASIEESLNKL